ncbi:MAG: riboflavin synthase [Rhodospirillales bacterium]
MFTGIVTHTGRVRSRTGGDGNARFVIESPFAADPAMGASVCCSGVCLTVVETKDGAFAADVSAETLSCTTLGGWEAGTPVNLERALCAGDELGGHIVSGHVDGVGRVISMAEDGASWRFEIEAPAALAPLIAEKGSIAVDGVSLTVNAVQGARFGVNIIPHTMAETALGGAGEGARVNLEIDMLARYVARLLDARTEKP